MGKDDMDAIDNPAGYYCPHEHKMCYDVKHCVYRANDGQCGLRKATFRKLGTLKRIQRMFYDFGRLLTRIWRDEERISSHDRKYIDKADRD